MCDKTFDLFFVAEIVADYVISDRVGTSFPLNVTTLHMNLEHKLVALLELDN